jgi:hypothetical protein
MKIYRITPPGTCSFKIPCGLLIVPIVNSCVFTKKKTTSFQEQIAPETTFYATTLASSTSVVVNNHRLDDNVATTMGNLSKESYTLFKHSILSTLTIPTFLGSSCHAIPCRQPLGYCTNTTSTLEKHVKRQKGNIIRTHYDRAQQRSIVMGVPSLMFTLWTNIVHK